VTLRRDCNISSAPPQTKIAKSRRSPPSISLVFSKRQNGKWKAGLNSFHDEDRSELLHGDTVRRWHDTLHCATIPRRLAQTKTTVPRLLRNRQDARLLHDLRGVGKATLTDLALLDIHDVAALAQQDPVLLYERLCARTGVRQDPCVLDVFSCAVAQARNPELPLAQRDWWWWSRIRKATRR